MGRNEPSPETTGECIRRRDCMDTVGMQMVYVEMEGQRRRDSDINKERTRTHRYFGRMHRHKCVVNTEKQQKIQILSVSLYVLPLSFSLFPFSPN